MITHDPNPLYVPAAERYTRIPYARVGKSGLRLPRISLGLWQNFGAVDTQARARKLLHTAFDQGITHFDLANNYGPNFGSAEEMAGLILHKDFAHHRDELIISSKAGYDMWPGPYGIGGSRKYLIASCDQSLKRTGLEYFDIFYHHCMDADTPLEETLQALDFIVRSGRALYVGLSNYQPAQTRAAIAILNDLGTPLLIHQPRYNLFDRWIEPELSGLLTDAGVGAIVFSPLAQGLLSDKYLQGIPEGSRAARSEQIYLNARDITPEKLAKIHALNQLAQTRGQTLAQMAQAWTLNNPAVTSCLIGASSEAQIIEAVGACHNLAFSREELSRIEAIVADAF